MKDKGEAAGMALRAGCLTCLDALLPEKAPLPRGLLYVSPVSAPGGWLSGSSKCL